MSYIQPNKAARDAAKRGLEARKKAAPSKRGGLSTTQAGRERVGSGVARARDIVAGKRVDAKQVHAFFQRFKGEFARQKRKHSDLMRRPERYPLAQAWLLWGGEPLRKQAAKAVETMARKKTKKKTTRRRSRRKNPISTDRLESRSGRGLAKNIYNIYIGSILAPKSLTPVAVYTSNETGYFYVFTPDKSLAVGAGYFGDSGDFWRECTRQHMLPGLVDPGDIGTGLGTTLYLGGNMTIAARDQNAEDKLRRGAPEDCTYSVESDRSADADRAWANMVKHDLAEEVEGEGEGEEESVEFEETDDYIFDDGAEERVASYAEVDTDRVTEASTTATIYYTGTVLREGEQEGQVMEWDTVKDSGLILHLSEHFDDPNDHTMIPPKVFAQAKWEHTPGERFIEYAKQNAAIAGRVDEFDPEDADVKTWIEEAACHFGGRGREKAEWLLELIGEQSQLELLEANPASCPTTYAKEARDWERRYGDDYVEEGEGLPDGSESNPRRRKKRSKNPKTAKKRSKLLRSLLR